MRKIKLLLLIFTVLTILSCKNNNSQTDYESETDDVSSTYEEEAYPDGTYCADIDYYNPDTGTRNTYTLNVEVEHNEVTVIHWPNGGWLDDSHFSPEELDSNGGCSFSTNDGKEYDVQITGPECSYTDESKMQDDVDDEKEAITCPECGDEKSDYDEYCYSCKRKFTCPDCGGKKAKYDELCYDCQRKQNEEQEKEDEEE